MLRHSRSRPHRQNKSAKSRKLRRLSFRHCGVLRTLASQDLYFNCLRGWYAPCTVHAIATISRKLETTQGRPLSLQHVFTMCGWSGSKGSSPLLWTLWTPWKRNSQFTDRFLSTRTHYIISVIRRLIIPDGTFAKQWTTLKLRWGFSCWAYINYPRPLKQRFHSTPCTIRGNTEFVSPSF